MLIFNHYQIYKETQEMKHIIILGDGMADHPVERQCRHLLCGQQFYQRPHRARILSFTPRHDDVQQDPTHMIRLQYLIR